MTTITPMRPHHFGPFSERTIARYAHENTASFRWDEATSTARARGYFRQLLPHGLETPGHYLYEILDDVEGATIGDLWFGITPAHDAPAAHLYDLHFDAGSGQAQQVKEALDLLEARCRALGARSIDLQIFAHDTLAQALYGTLGFNVTSFNMSKQLGAV